MKRFFFIGGFVSVVGFCLAMAGAVSAQSVGVRLLNEGMELDAGSVGKLVLDYPKLFDGTQQVESKLIAREVGKERAVLSYEGGSKLTVSVGAQGKVALDFVEKAAGVKNLILEMQIPMGFNQGGSWKIGDKTAVFPVQKPEGNPHLFQGNAESLTVVNFEGRSLTVKPPGFSFLQLSDNREWNWPIFFWKSITPLDAHGAGMVIELALGGDGSAAKPLVDGMGQSTRAEWADKVKSLEELKGDVVKEEEYLKGLASFDRDEFGGLPGSKEKLSLQATGFFHVEKKGERWLLVDPVGNAFFHVGVCGFNPNDDYTLTKGRESAYEWLPGTKGEFESVFREGSEGTIMSFHLVNQIRKYGQPFEANAYAERMIGRLRKWGFSSVGAFTELGFGAEARKKAKFPGVAHLPINAWEKVPRIAGIHEVFDPFDEGTKRQIEENMAGFLPGHADDPLIIGYYMVNEPIYEQIPVMVPSLKGSEHACKRELVAWLEKKYEGSVAKFNGAWGLKVAGFGELLEMGMPMTTEAAKADAVGFAEVFLEAYLTLVKESFRKFDANHLLIGSRLQPATIKNEWICRVMGRHVDVMSFNYYTYGLDKELLKKVYEWTGGKPMLLSEFFWSSPTDSGLTGGREVGSQQERGLAYRNYVEQAASLGFVLGVEWFTLVDQSVTGRWFSGFDGERANTGLISVVDRPWKGLLEEMMKAHRAVYPVWLGELAPFSWDDARFKAGE